MIHFLKCGVKKAQFVLELFEANLGTDQTVLAAELLHFIVNSPPFIVSRPKLVLSENVEDMRDSISFFLLQFGIRSEFVPDLSFHIDGTLFENLDMEGSFGLQSFLAGIFTIFLHLGKFNK